MRIQDSHGKRSFPGLIMKVVGPRNFLFNRKFRWNFLLNKKAHSFLFMRITSRSTFFLYDRRDHNMNIVLYEPEMPANTGNIGRTCVATNTKLHLIEPLGFKLSEKHLVRAGLDYWDKLDVTVYSDYQDFLKKNPRAKIYMATTKGEHVYTDVPYDPDAYIMFGPESRGIPEEILVENRENCIRIPMWGDIRSLNLSNSVAIVLYEALRQNGFEKMTMEGHLHHLHWKE